MSGCTSPPPLSRAERRVYPLSCSRHVAARCLGRFSDRSSQACACEASGARHLPSSATMRVLFCTRTEMPTECAVQTGIFPTPPPGGGARPTPNGSSCREVSVLGASWSLPAAQGISSIIMACFMPRRSIAEDMSRSGMHFVPASAGLTFPGTLWMLIAFSCTFCCTHRYLVLM